MQNLNLLTTTALNKTLKLRKGETKFGEQIKLITSNTTIYDDIANLDVDYVIFGIAEDIGVTANHGISGTYNAWNATKKVLLNIQSNVFLKANRVLVLGHLDYSDYLKQLAASNLTAKERITKARQYTELIDKDVTHLVFTIIKSGKTPIIIGGGHNNAYGNIKGASLALNQSINAINFDAHHDFRATEGRHSGNGFSYAYKEGFLKNYYIFGLHENYVSKKSLALLNTTKTIKYTTFESIVVKQSVSFKKALKKGIKHVSETRFGIEIDCDAIENIPSSAMTPSGFSVTKTRQFVNITGTSKNAAYLHICEAAPKTKTETKVGKLITYLITDFIKAHNDK